MGEQAARKRERRAAQGRVMMQATAVRPAADAGRSQRVVAALIATVVVIGAGATGFLVWMSRQGDASAGGAAPPPPSVHAAARYRAVYRVVDSAGPQVIDQTDVVSVRRPDEVRVEHHEGAPPGGRIFSGSIINRTSQTFLPDRSKGFATPLTVVLNPNVFSEPALSAAAEAGAVARLGLGSVAGQQCTRYLYRDTGTETLARGDEQQKVEVCVTTDDILLRQVVTLAGRQVRLSEAVQLDRSPAFSADEFTPGAGANSRGAEATERVVEGRPTGAGTLVAPELPSGFRLDRQLTDSHQEIDTPLLPFYIESWVRGGEFADTEQLMIANGADRPWQSSGGTPVTLSGGLTGQILYHPGYVEVQTTLGGYPVRVLASSAELATYVAGTLHAAT
jgi:hypothetical protein